MTKPLDLSCLSDDVEDNWTEDGTPSLAAVEKLLSRKVSRPEIAKSGRVRYQTPRKTAAPTAPVDYRLEILKAEERVSAIRVRFADAQVRLKAARSLYADAITAWQMANPPPSTDQAYRLHLARQAQHSAEGNVAAAQPVVRRSVLDEVMSQTGGRATRNAAARKVRGLIR
ncbi:hypothetical protein L6654_24190 [Bradyrhizobium sp. WYCCWR 13023]|uniref:Uncharacterized protein n=1 Tax=Bradyrhizobium zhengyangense TaxID=2911009 RepID=A0A9X1UC67_9BRAD|nr:hypothetical protein [Bradyrhizobium zhengyangense]MCG2629728.1 hypothetical protein [Bradyrhizobium zhengyangense]